MVREKMGWKPIVLYILAIIFAIYTVYSLISTAQYIGQMVAAQYIQVGSSFGEILAYFVSNVGAYLVYAALLGSAGYGIDVLERGAAPKKEKQPKAKREKAPKEKGSKKAADKVEEVAKDIKEEVTEVAEEAEEKTEMLKEAVEEKIDEAKDAE